MIAQHPGGTSSGHAGQAIKAVNRDPGGTPVGKLNTASDLLFLQLLPPEQRPQNADAAKRKEPQGAVALRIFSFATARFFIHTQRKIYFFQ